MTRQPDIKPGQKVAWKWGKGKAEGKVTKVHTAEVIETIKGAEVKRKATPEKPAVDIKTNKGGKVLKSVTEIKKK